MAISEVRLFGRFDSDDLRARLEHAEVLEALATRGFGRCEVEVENDGVVLPRVRVFGEKSGGRFLLVDASLGEATIPEPFFRVRGYEIDRPLDLALVYWLHEEDPTRAFRADRPALPLQHHPGLGCLRRAFRVIVEISGELGRDGIASVPKFFHDAVLFFRSRLFLFLDPVEQGRFEAMLRDLATLALGDASLALIGGAVQDGQANTVRWQPAFQVFPLSERATNWFHSEAYAAEVQRSLERSRFHYDRAILETTRRAFGV